MIGTVVWFNEDKGYGFIYSPEMCGEWNKIGTGGHVFVHYSQIISDSKYKTLVSNQIVDFSIANTLKGMQALSVTSI